MHTKGRHKIHRQIKFLNKIDLDLTPNKNKTDPIHTAYRPITMTSILTKALEAAIKGRFEEAMAGKSRGLNQYALAYRTGQGADLAVLMCVETVLLA